MARKAKASLVKRQFPLKNGSVGQVVGLAVCRTVPERA